jgi:L-lactate dehydrogenase complex protein LldG
MSARENILRRIRAQSGRPGATSEAERDAARAHIAGQQRGPVPALARAPMVENFVRECARLKSTVEELATRSEAPQAVARYLKSQSLDCSAVGWSNLADLDWSGAGVDYAARLATRNDLVGITDCFCAISETGTLLLLSSPTTPKLHALLPETHICVVSRARLVPTMEDAFALLRKEVGELPRATFFVSGPSRTADIEQTIVIGAHGPYRVHVLLVP